MRRPGPWSWTSTSPRARTPAAALPRQLRAGTEGTLSASAACAHDDLPGQETQKHRTAGAAPGASGGELHVRLVLSLPGFLVLLLGLTGLLVARLVERRHEHDEQDGGGHD